MLKQDLGRLESVYGIAPSFLQRAAFVAALSFIFFLAMLIAFSVRQNVGYFVLATAFLVVEIFTLIGWFSQRGAEFKIFERGFTYKKTIAAWEDIKAVTEERKNRYQISLLNGEKILLTEMIGHADQIVVRLRAETAQKTDA